MSQVRQLYRLQQIDTQVTQKKKRLTEVIRLQKETDELIAGRQAAEVAAQGLQKWRTRQSELNLELGAANDEARRTEQRLYSGNVKNPKELADLQQKVESLGRRRASLEDDILEAMIMSEDNEEALQIASESLAEIETAWNSHQTKLKQEQNELALNLGQLLESRNQQAKLVEERQLNDYEGLKRRKGGVAVAALKDNSCSGCHLTVSADKIKRAQLGDIVYCGGCGRILNPL